MKRVVFCWAVLWFVSFESAGEKISNLRLAGDLVAGSMVLGEERVLWVHDLSTGETRELYRGDWVWGGLGFSTAQYLKWTVGRRSYRVMEVASKEISAIEVGRYVTLGGFVADSRFIIGQEPASSLGLELLRLIGLRWIRPEYGILHLWDIETGRKMRSSRMDYDVIVWPFTAVRLGGDRILIAQQWGTGSERRQELRVLHLDSLDDVVNAVEIRSLEWVYDLMAVEGGALVLGREGTELVVVKAQLVEGVELAMENVARVASDLDSPMGRLAREHVLFFDHDGQLLRLHNFVTGVEIEVPKAVPNYSVGPERSRFVSWDGETFDIWEIGEGDELALIASGRLEGFEPVRVVVEWE